MRVVSLTCSNTEIVCALGCSNLLVGVDDHSDYPMDVVSGLPRVGRDLQIDVAKVKALEPDLVLASLTVPGHELVVDSLEKSGLNYLTTEPVSLEDVYNNIRVIAASLEVSERAETVISNFIAEIETYSPEYNPSILVQWWPKPVIAPCKLSWVNDLITAAGGINPLADLNLKSKPLEDAEVAEINPDIIIIAWCGVKIEKYRPEVVYRNSEFSKVNAVMNKQVHKISECHLGRPSPLLTGGYSALRKLVEDFQS